MSAFAQVWNKDLATNVRGSEPETRDMEVSESESEQSSQAWSRYRGTSERERGTPTVTGNPALRIADLVRKAILVGHLVVLLRSSARKRLEKGRRERRAELGSSSLR